MKYILDVLDKLSFSKDDEENNNGESMIEEMFDDLMRSVRRRFSPEKEHMSTMSTKCRKAAIENRYTSDKLVDVSDRRRHSLARVKNVENELQTSKCMAVKEQRRSEGSLIDTAKSKLLPVQNDKKETVAEAVARKLAERKREYRVLSRPQTIQLMKMKYNLDKKSG